MKRKYFILGMVLLLSSSAYAISENYDFDNDHYMGFKNIDLKNLNMSNSLPSWYVHGKLLRHRNNNADSMLLLKDEINSGNFTVSFDIYYLNRDLDNTKVGYVFNYKDSSNYMLLEVSSKTAIVKNVILYEVKNTMKKELISKEYVFNKAKTSFKLDLSDNSLNIDITDERVYSFQLVNLEEKKLLKNGFYLKNSAKNIAFDNLFINYKKEQKESKPKIVQVIKPIEKETKVNIVEITKPVVKESKAKTVTREIKEQSPSKKPKKSNIFYIEYDLGFGKSIAQKKEKSGVIYLNDDFEESSLSHNFEIGHFYTQNISVAFNYFTLKMKNRDLDNFYFTANRRFLYKDLKPFIGLRAGYSLLTWDKDLLGSSSQRRYSSKKVFYGLQAGIEYELKKNLSFIGKYSFDYINHKTILESNNAYNIIEQKYLNNIAIGLRYYFKD